MSLSRRAVLQRAGVTSALLAASPFLINRGIIPAAFAQDDAQPTAGGTLNVGFTTDLANLDPFASALNNWVAVRNAVYETLAWPDPAANMEIQPLLAESWAWSEDQLQLTVTLRSGITFHDGSEFSSRDVRFSVERVMDPETASYLAGIFGSVDSVEDVDPQTIRFNLSRPSRPLLTGLTQVHIVSANNEATYTENPIGTGPFKWVGWDPNVQIEVARNDQYWQPDIPLLDGIVWKLIPNIETMNVTLQTGGVHWFNTPSLQDVERLQADSQLNVAITPPLERGFWIYNNMTKPPFDNQLVRQAMSFAMDREAVVEAAIAGLGVANCAYLAPEHPLHNPAVKDKYAYNLDRTRELLAEAGYADPSELQFRIMAYASLPAHVLIAQILQASLAEIGVQAEIEQVDIATAQARRESGDWELQIDGLGRISGDPHLEILRGIVMQPGPQNVCGLQPGMFPEYDALLVRAESAIDPEEMRDAYYAFQDMLSDINPTLMVAHHAQVEVTRTELREYQLHPWFYYDYRPMWLANG